MNPVVHFEMPYEDRERAASFYHTAFGWKPQMLGADMGEYVVMQTGETDEKGMLTTPGMINGGMYKKPEDPMGAAPSFVIAVDDIEAAMKKVVDAGGTIIGSSGGKMTPDMIPGIGLYISIKDTEGNRVSLLQPNPRM